MDAVDDFSHHFHDNIDSAEPLNPYTSVFKKRSSSIQVSSSSILCQLSMSSNVTLSST